VEELRPDDPQQIGSYRLLGRLGSGGMGQVFLGRSPGGRPVAVKAIRPELADSPDFRHRFAHEVAAARRVSGVFTAPVVDADPEAPQPWLVTAYVAGPSLADRVKNNGAMPERDVIRLGCALAEELAAIHAAGIVRRDLKPSNVLLASDGPRIIDFGISRATEATSLTQSGLVVGSPGFMSPEQAEGREVNAASDVFSLGAVLAFVATGTGPFGTGAASAMLYRVVPAEPDLTSVSGGLRDVLLACLRKNPAERQPQPTTWLRRSTAGPSASARLRKCSTGRADRRSHLAPRQTRRCSGVDGSHGTAIQH
jgi:serine/threonine protein kinase